MEEICFNPITLESIKINDWLEEDEDNIVFYINDLKLKQPIIGLKKSYFLNPHMNDIYLNCIIENKALMINDTYKSENYRNIGYFFNKYVMINNKELIKTLKKGNSFSINLVDHEKKEFISQETLELSNIGLINTVKSKKKYIDLNNLPYGNEDVYFDNLLSSALYEYTDIWDKPINSYLRLGDPYFNSSTFRKFHHKYGISEFYYILTTLIAGINKNTINDIPLHPTVKKLGYNPEILIKYKKDLVTLKKELKEDLIKKNIELGKKKTKDKILLLDKCLLEFAPRVDNKMATKNVYYRGMTQLYEHGKVGDEIVVSNYISISENMGVAYNFWDKSTFCCIYKFKLSPGLPYINMINNTKYKNEKETLLPRDLKIRLTSIENKIYNRQQHKIYNVLVLKTSENQFKIDTGCRLYNTVSIKSNQKIKNTKNKDVINLKPNNINEQLKDIPHKLSKNCNEGFICPDNKICNPDSGRCVLKSGSSGKNILELQKQKLVQKKVDIVVDNNIVTVSPNPDIDKHKTKKINNKNCNLGYMCPDNQICNPDSGRCVSKTGPTGKKILEELAKKQVIDKNKTKKIHLKKTTVVSDKNKTKKNNNITYKVVDNKHNTNKKDNKNCNLDFICPNNQICNKESGRCVSKTGPTGKKLLELQKLPVLDNNKQQVVDKDKEIVQLECKDKYFIVRGETTKRIIDELKGLNGKYNYTMKGWTFKWSDIESVINLLKTKKIEFIISNDNLSTKSYNNLKPIDDVLDNLITINGHGGYNKEKIIVPDWCHIMIPHNNGLDSDYTTPDASKNRLYEEDLYKNGFFNYKKGWKLYLPGDSINNLVIAPFHDGNDCKSIEDEHILQKPLIKKCNVDTKNNHLSHYNKFCPLYCTKKISNGTYDYILYNKKRKLKIKCCSRYDLKFLLSELQNSLNNIDKSLRNLITPKINDTIVLIPYTCNAKSGSISNGFSTLTTPLNTIYQDLLIERLIK